MIARVSMSSPACAAVLDRASDLLGRDLSAHYAKGTEALTCNRDVQVGVFLANHLHLTALEAHGGRGDRSLGLSLGEYNHLVHIGALSFDAALRLVDARGMLYDAGPEGMMASVFPLATPALEAVVDASRSRGVVEIGGYNSPSQHVLTGERAAVRHALEIIEQEHYAQSVIIEQQIPMHCSLFRPVAEQLRSHLEQAPWRVPHAPYLPNATGQPITDPTREDFIEQLTDHVHRPVRWRESIELLATAHPEAIFVETGPQAVLYNLLQKRWLQTTKLKTDDPTDPLKTLLATAERLRDVA